MTKLAATNITVNVFLMLLTFHKYSLWQPECDQLGRRQSCAYLLTRFSVISAQDGILLPRRFEIECQGIEFLIVVPFQLHKTVLAETEGGDGISGSAVRQDHAH